MKTLILVMGGTLIAARSLYVLGRNVLWNAADDIGRQRTIRALSRGIGRPMPKHRSQEGWF